MAQRVTAIRKVLADVARRSVRAVEGRAQVVKRLASVNRQRYRAVWAVGKAAAQMMDGALFALDPEVAFVLTRQGARDGVILPANTEVRDASHPLTDARGCEATDALLSSATSMRAEDCVLLLLSGGTSALLGAPVAGLSLDAINAALSSLMRQAQPIEALNTVRRAVSRALGGRLAQACPAHIDCLAISDVLDDAPHTIGSGPVSASPTTRDDAIALLTRMGEDSLARQLVRVSDAEPPRHDAPCFSRVSFEILAGPRDLSRAAAQAITHQGFVPVLREALLRDEVGVELERLLMSASGLGPRDVLVAVGEPTVRVHGHGQGGRMQELAMRLARAISGTDFVALCCASDGSDGGTAHAGAIVDGETALRAGKLLDQALADNNSFPLFASLGDAIILGATGTNVTDLVLITRAG